MSSLRFYGEFMLEDDSGLSGRCLVNENELKNDASGAYYPGVITQQTEYEYVIEFNKDCDAWCYGWTSNKQRTFFYHVFQVTVLQLSSGALTPLASIRSPHFNIFSSRRRKEIDIQMPSPAIPTTSSPPARAREVSKKRTTSRRKSAPASDVPAVVELNTPMERVIVNCKQIIIDAQQRLALYKQIKAEKQRQRLPIVAHAGVTSRAHSPLNPSLKLHTAVRSLGPMPVKLLYDPLKMQDCDFDSLFGEGGTSETLSTCSV